MRIFFAGRFPGVLALLIMNMTALSILSLTWTSTFDYAVINSIFAARVVDGEMG
jgi:hypothetical protein